MQDGDDEDEDIPEESVDDSDSERGTPPTASNFLNNLNFLRESYDAHLVVLLSVSLLHQVG